MTDLPVPLLSRAGMNVYLCQTYTSRDMTDLPVPLLSRAGVDIYLCVIYTTRDMTDLPVPLLSWGPFHQNLRCDNSADCKSLI